MPKFDSVLFDLDGTLSDSYLGIEKGIKIALEKIGINDITPDLIKKMIGIPLDQSLGRFIFNGDNEANSEAISRIIGYFREYYSTIGLYESELYPDIPEILEKLSRDSRIYIITAKPTAYANKILTHHGIIHYFNEIYGFNGEIGFHKSDLINRISPKTNSIIIGDKNHDIAAGKKAGIMTAGVVYGYGSRLEIINSCPDYIIEKPSDLIRILS